MLKGRGYVFRQVKLGDKKVWAKKGGGATVKKNDKII